MLPRGDGQLSEVIAATRLLLFLNGIEIVHGLLAIEFRSLSAASVASVCLCMFFIIKQAFSVHYSNRCMRVNRRQFYP